MDKNGVNTTNSPSRGFQGDTAPAPPHDAHINNGKIYDSQVLSPHAQMPRSRKSPGWIVFIVITCIVTAFCLLGFSALVTNNSPTVTTSPAFPLLFLLVYGLVVALPVVLVHIRRCKKECEAAEAQQTEEMLKIPLEEFDDLEVEQLAIEAQPSAEAQQTDEMLKIPLEKFGDLEAEQLAKKYEDPNAGQ